MQNSKVDLKRADSALEWASRLAAIACLVYFVYALYAFPEEIPTHFDITGKADATGSRSSLWLLIIIPIGLWIGLTLLQRRPDRFNYAVDIHPENQQHQFLLAHRLLATYKLNILIVTLLLLWNVHGITLNIPHPGEGVFACVMLTLVALPLPVYLYFSMRKQKAS